MSAPDDDRDGETTADWPGTQSEAAADDGEATTVVPQTPQRGAPPPMSPPPQGAPPSAAVPPPPTSPPQTGHRDPRWQSAPGPGALPPAGGPWTPPGPAGHYPPGAPPDAPTPPKWRRWGLLGAGALCLVAIVVAAAVFVTQSGDSSTPPAARSSTPTAATSPASASASAPSTTASTSPAPTTLDIVQPTALKGLLASAAEVTQIASKVAPDAMMTPTGDQTSPIIGVHIDPFKCTGAVMTGMYTTYIGMGTAFVVQTLTNGSPHIDVTQALTSFSSGDDAKKFVDLQFQDWQACDDTDVIGTVDGRYGGPPQHGRLSKTDNSQGVNVNLLSPLPGAKGRQCQHVMSARNNVVVDVRVCAPDVGNMGLNLDQVIGQKITAQQ